LLFVGKKKKQNKKTISQQCILCGSDMLGRRLEVDSDGQLASEAHLCYVVSGNTEQLVASWDKVLASSASNNTLQVIMSVGAPTLFVGPVVFSPNFQQLDLRRLV